MSTFFPWGEALLCLRSRTCRVEQSYKLELSQIEQGKKGRPIFGLENCWRGRFLLLLKWQKESNTGPCSTVRTFCSSVPPSLRGLWSKESACTKKWWQIARKDSFNAVTVRTNAMVHHCILLLHHESITAAVAIHIANCNATSKLRWCGPGWDLSRRCV